MALVPTLCQQVLVIAQVLCVLLLAWLAVPGHNLGQTWSEHTFVCVCVCVSPGDVYVFDSVFKNTYRKFMV